MNNGFSIYETEKDIKDLMRMLDIEIKSENILPNNTILLDKNSQKPTNRFTRGCS